jgi:chromosome segregation ATPase
VDVTVDMRTDAGEEGRWMSYAELAAARGIDRTSALKLALRRKWRKQTDNRGTVRVYVPLEWGTPADKRAATGAPPGVDLSTVIGTLDAAVSALREQLDRAEAGREAERNRADRAENRADQAERRAEGLHDQIANVRAQLSAAQAELVAAQGLRRELDAAQARADGAEGRAQQAENRRADLRERLDAIQAQLAAVPDQAEAAQDLRRALEAAQADVEQVVQGRETAEAQATELAAQLHQARAEAQDARGRLADVERDNDARKARGLVVRLRAAWRGQD